MVTWWPLPCEQTDRQTHMTENITFSQLRWRTVKIVKWARNSCSVEVHWSSTNILHRNISRQFVWFKIVRQMWKIKSLTRTRQIVLHIYKMPLNDRFWKQIDSFIRSWTMKFCCRKSGTEISAVNWNEFCVLNSGSCSCDYHSIVNFDGIL